MLKNTHADQIHNHADGSENASTTSAVSVRGMVMSSRSPAALYRSIRISIIIAHNSTQVIPPFTATCIQPNANSGAIGRPSPGSGLLSGSRASLMLSPTVNSKSAIMAYTGKYLMENRIMFF